jgi:hypothetical protein
MILNSFPFIPEDTADNGHLARNVIQMRQIMPSLIAKIAMQMRIAGKIIQMQIA